MGFLRTTIDAILHAGGRLFAGPYRGGDVTRLNKAWQPSLYSGDRAVAESWQMMTARLRDLQRNDPAVIALKRALTNGVISTGINCVSNAVIGGQLDDEFNEEADESFEDWAETEADYFGRLSWSGIQRQAFGEVLETGDALVLRTQSADPDRFIPLSYQVLEAEQLDSTMDRPAGRGQNEIRRGIELGPDRRPVAYWLFEVHPDDPGAPLGANRSVRIPAERVIHVMSPARPSQTRGASLYSSVVQSARDLDNYLGSELTSAIIASLLTIVHKTKSPGNGFGFSGDGSDNETTDAAGNPKIKLGRGIVSQIPLNDSIEVVDPKRPNNAADTFTRLILMLIGMGGGVSRYKLTRDFTSTTFVSARAADLCDRDGFRPLQAYVARQLVLPVRREWTRQMVAFGRFASLLPKQFNANRRAWQRVKMLYPGAEMIDPASETNAELAGIDGGTLTYEEAHARRGKHWMRQFRQRAREERYAERLVLRLQRRATAIQPPAAGAENTPDRERIPSEETADDA